MQGSTATQLSTSSRAVSTLTDDVQHFIDNPGLIVDMDRQSRFLAEERFDVEIVNTRMIETVEL